MPERPTFVERLIRNIRRDEDTDCWLWQSSLNVHGYGTVTVDNKPVIAHRWVWLNVHGEIPEGQQLDHLCRVRECVNPGHLEVVTASENTRRAYAANGVGETCKRGHSRAIFGRPQACGRTSCAECSRITHYLRNGATPRYRRTVCEHCGRNVAEQNLSRHEQSCLRKQSGCKNGHPLTPDNLSIWRSRSGFEMRDCKTCNREAQARRRARAKAGTS